MKAFVPSTSFWCVQSITNDQSTLLLFGTRNKHLSHKLDHVQRNKSRLIEGNDTPFENQLETLNFPNLYLCKDFLVCKLLKFIKSDFATNFEDYMSFKTENGNKTQCHRYKR